MTTTAWTLLHFVWQGTLVAGLLALFLALTRTRRSDVRYALSVGALALMAVCPLVTAWYLNAGGVSSRDISVTSTGRSPSDVAPLASANQPSGAEDSRLRERRTDAQTPPARPRAADRLAVGDDSAPFPSAAIWSTISARVRAWGTASASYLVAAWLAGVLLLSIRVLGGWFAVRRLVTHDVREGSAALKRLTADVARRLPLDRAVRVLESARLQVPAVVGWIKPTLLVPLSFESAIPLPELELLLAHELAHIRRHDYLVNLAQTLVETVLFYHPAVWWVSRQVREEREHCCDDVAVALTADRRAYAEALLRLEQMRQPAPLLAAAATGGNLFRRIERLMIDRRQLHDEPRPRWVVAPVAMAALAAMATGLPLERTKGAAVLAAVVTPTSLLGERFTPDGGAPGIQQGVQQARSRNAAPDTVIQYSGSASLDERVSWALARAARERRPAFWVGYSIANDPSRGMLYIDRHVPVTAQGSVFTGRMRFGPRGGTSGLIFSGVRLDSLIGPRSPDEQILFLGYSRTGSGDAQLDRVHLASGMLPMHFAGRTAYWLGESDDAASIALVRRLFGETRMAELKGDLVAVTGAHVDGSAALGSLRAWLASNESEDVRAEIAEELAQVGTPASLALLARTARADRTRRVRAEAAEALGEHRLPEAADTLVRVLGDLDDGDVRREAIEALGERTEPVAFRALVRAAWDDPNSSVQREAVETIGESKAEGRVDELARILREHPRSEVRAEAAETLGEVEEPTQVLPILRSAIERDANSEVRGEAIETLGEVGTEDATALLAQLARSHRDIETRKRALDALAEKDEGGAVYEILEEMLNRGGDVRMQEHAAEALGEVDDVRAVRALERAATSHPSSSVQRASADALGSAAPVEQAWEALTRIAATHPDAEVAGQALESLGNIEHDGAVAVFVRTASTHQSREVRRKAVEMLGDVDRDEARQALERLARTANDEEIQRTAIEAYADAAPKAAAVTLLASLVRGANREDVQRVALEELADLDDGAGLPAMIETARSHPNPEMRRRAIEHLGDADDPRAAEELAKLLRARDREE